MCNILQPHDLCNGMEHLVRSGSVLYSYTCHCKVTASFEEKDSSVLRPRTWPTERESGVKNANPQGLPLTRPRTDCCRRSQPLLQLPQHQQSRIRLLLRGRGCYSCLCRQHPAVLAAVSATCPRQRMEQGWLVRQNRPAQQAADKDT